MAKLFSIDLQDLQLGGKITGYNLVSVSNIPINYVNIFFVWYTNTNGDKSIHVLYHSRIRRKVVYSLLWRHAGRDGISNHQSYDCLLNRLFSRRSKKTSKLRVTGFCAGN